MIKAVIFDLDGVVMEGKYMSTHAQDIWKIPKQKMLDVLKSKEMNLTRIGKYDENKLWQKFIDDNNIPVSLDEFFEIWFSLEKPNKEIMDFVKFLRSKGIITIICSNNFKRRVEHLEKKFKLSEKFDYVIWGCYTKTPKPKSFELVAEKIGLKPEEILVMEDREKNIKECEELRFQTIKVECIENKVNTKKLIEVIKERLGE